ncbi:KN motif and ankyrin repeat domain [Sparganum proliferum]
MPTPMTKTANIPLFSFDRVAAKHRSTVAATINSSMALYNEHFQQNDDYADDSVFQEPPAVAVQRRYQPQEYSRQKVPGSRYAAVGNVAYVQPTFYKPVSVHAEDPTKFPVTDEDEFMTYATSTRLRSEYNEYGVLVETNADEYEKKVLPSSQLRYPNDLNFTDQELYRVKQENERLRTLLENRELNQDSYDNENYLFSEEIASNLQRRQKNIDSEIYRLQQENRQLRSYLEENRYDFENANDATDYDDDFEEIIEETTTTTRPAPVQALPYAQQGNAQAVAVTAQRSVGVGDIDVNQFYLLGTGTRSIDPADFPRPFWERISEYFTERYRQETRIQPQHPPLLTPSRNTPVDKHASLKNFGVSVRPRCEDVGTVAQTDLFSAPQQIKQDSSCMTDPLDGYFARLLRSLAPQCPNADADFIRNLYRYSQYDCSEFIHRLVTKLSELRRVSRDEQPRRAIVRSESVGVSARPVMADKRTSSMPPMRQNLGTNTDIPIQRSQGMTHAPETPEKSEIGCSTSTFFRTVDHANQCLSNHFTSIGITQTTDNPMDDPTSSRAVSQVLTERKVNTYRTHSVSHQHQLIPSDQLHKMQSPTPQANTQSSGTAPLTAKPQESQIVKNLSKSENIHLDTWDTQMVRPKEPSQSSVPISTRENFPSEQRRPVSNSRVTHEAVGATDTPSSHPVRRIPLSTEKSLSEPTPTTPSRQLTTTTPSLEKPQSALLSYPATEVTVTFKAESSPTLTQSRLATVRQDDSVRYSDSSHSLSQATTSDARPSSSVSMRSEDIPVVSLPKPVRIPLRNYSFQTQKITAACDALAKWYKSTPGSTDAPPSETQKHLELMRQVWFDAMCRVDIDVHTVEDMFAFMYNCAPVLLYNFIRMPRSAGTTCLHYAVGHGSWRVVNLILDTNYADPDQVNASGFSPIMIAAVSDSLTESALRVVDKLFAAGNVNARAQTSAQQTPLILAARKANAAPVVRLLLQHGADINCQDASGNTALMCAIDRGQVEVAKMLLARPDIQLNSQDKEGKTALDIAQAGGQAEITQIIREKLAVRQTVSLPDSDASQQHGSSRVRFALHQPPEVPTAESVGTRIHRVHHTFTFSQDTSHN